MKKLSEHEIIAMMKKKNKFLSEDVEIFRLGNEQCAPVSYTHLTLTTIYSV